MATTVGEIVKVLKAWAPLSLKESWDNPGLLIGSPDEPVDKLMVTLDVMMGTVDYAIEQCRDLLENGVPGLHIFTLNKGHATSRLVDALGSYFTG